MRKIINKTTRPLRVRLAQGKVLHLGPRKEGQISVHDIDRKSVQEMIEAGEIELLADGDQGSAAEGSNQAGHENTHGHHHGTQPYRRGDR